MGSNSAKGGHSPLIWVRRDWLSAPDSGCTSKCGGSWASRPERFSPCCWRSQLEVEAMSVMVEVVVEVLVVEVVVVMVARGPQCHTACRFSPEATAPVKIAAPTYDDYTLLPWRHDVLAGCPEIREKEIISFARQHAASPCSDYARDTRQSVLSVWKDNMPNSALDNHMQATDEILPF